MTEASESPWREVCDLERGCRLQGGHVQTSHREHGWPEEAKTQAHSSLRVLSSGSVRQTVLKHTGRRRIKYSIWAEKGNASSGLLSVWKPHLIKLTRNAWCLGGLVRGNTYSSETVVAYNWQKRSWFWISEPAATQLQTMMRENKKTCFTANYSFVTYFWSLLSHTHSMPHRETAKYLGQSSLWLNKQFVLLFYNHPVHVTKGDHNCLA